MLYIFAGFPKNGLHAGGLQHAIETVENLAILEHDQNGQYRKEGVFTPGQRGEFLFPVEHRLSARCLCDGITWDWFPVNWSFGNGITTHKTLASLEYKTVVHGTDLTMEQFLETNDSPVRPGDVLIERKQIRHEDWKKYEARWLPGACPQENHIVHLTWLVSTHKLPEFAYQRIRELIEDDADPRNGHLYTTEPGKHFSELRRYSGKSAYGGANALPVC